MISKQRNINLPGPCTPRHPNRGHFCRRFQHEARRRLKLQIKDRQQGSQVSCDDLNGNHGQVDSFRTEKTVGSMVGTLPYYCRYNTYTYVWRNNKVYATYDVRMQRKYHIRRERQQPNRVFSSSRNSSAGPTIAVYNAKLCVFAPFTFLGWHKDITKSVLGSACGFSDTGAWHRLAPSHGLPSKQETQHCLR